LYSLNTPNVAKVYIMLELLELPFEVVTVNIMKGDQFKDEYIQINPNSKIPAIADPNVPAGSQPIILFESGNILVYLAQIYGQGNYLPNSQSNAQEHYNVLGWLFFQMSSIGPNMGQYHHYTAYTKDNVDYSRKRHYNEVRRLFHVIEKQLAKHAFVAGHQLSIADVAIYPWSKYIHTYPDLSESEFPLLYDYHRRMALLPASQSYERYNDSLSDAKKTELSEEERKILFGR
ncbi:hypothetical protein SAMD00019534_006790, partial [Acytostelium subglobosum LB1]|uniref:hypothetical protein n=1 Tax=Acytostelium subglobosum LB1 TaxID=1410327 RepID=UPI0006449320